MGVPMRARKRAVALTRRVLGGLDISLRRLSRTTPAKRSRFIADAGVTVLVDVGAYVGAYALEARRGGFTGRIESFEPQPGPDEILRERAAVDPLWTCHKVAVGDHSGTLTMHVADNEVSSSALAMLPRHVQGDPASGYVRTEIAEAARLDDLDLVGTDDVLHVKVDVQGYEKRVLDGAKRTLERAALVELELSLVRLYEGGPLCAEISSTWPSVASSPFGWTRPSSTRRPVGCYRRAESSPGGPDAVTAFSHEAAHRRTYRS